MRSHTTLLGQEIVGITERATLPAGAIDCGGDIASPGLIELHTDKLERQIRPRPGVHWPHAAVLIAHYAKLASCGIATVLDAIRAQGALRVSHQLHLRAKSSSYTLTEEFGEADCVGIVSLMDHTPGSGNSRTSSNMRPT